VQFFFDHGQGRGASRRLILQAKKNEQNPRRPTPSGPPDFLELSQLDEISANGRWADSRRVSHACWNGEGSRTRWRTIQAVWRRRRQLNHTHGFREAEALGNYYNIYYKRIGGVGWKRGMKTALDGFKAAHLGILIQPRVRPSPTPAATTTPSMSADALAQRAPLPAPRQRQAPQVAGPTASPALPAHAYSIASAIPSPSAKPSPSGGEEP